MASAEHTGAEAEPTGRPYGPSRTHGRADASRPGTPANGRLVNEYLARVTVLAVVALIAAQWLATR